MNVYKSRGLKSFQERDFQNALFNFSLALNEKPEDDEIQVCAILADLALEKEDEAMTLYEYYKDHVKSGNEESKQLFDSLLDALSMGIENLQQTLEEKVFLSKIEEENGIAYADFMSLVEARGDFRAVFEDIMFSTKVVITGKDDFVDFLNHLIDNGFEEISLNYIENAILMFPSDEKIKELAIKIEKVIKNENTSKS